MTTVTVGGKTYTKPENAQAWWLAEARRAEQTAPVSPAPAPTTPVAPTTAPVNQMDAIKNLPQYQVLLSKWYKAEDIEKAVAWYKPPTPQVQPQAKVEPATPIKPAEQVATTQQEPAKIEPKKDMNKTGTMELLPISEYQDDSSERMNNIVANLNSYRQSTPQFMSNIDVFRDNFAYEKRSDQQKKLLDNWFTGYQKGLELNGKNLGDLSTLYTSGNISDTDLEQLKLQNPNKYAELMANIDKKTALMKYDNMLNGEDKENPFQDIIKNWSNNMLNMAIKAPTNIFSEYKEAMNSENIKNLQTELADKEWQIMQIDEQINQVRRNIEARYEWKGASRGKINAIIQDEIWKLQESRNSLAIDYQTTSKKYNNEMATIKDWFEMQIKEQEFNNTQRTQQMQEMWFMMNLMNFETNEMKDERERNKFIRQQEYVDGNIYSSDPATRRKAIEKSVDRVLSEFQWIPMIRSREEMIADIQRMVDNWKELWEAITENIRKPIMNKPEYKKWVNDKFWIDTSKNLVNIWWVDYLMDEQWNFSLPTLPWVWLDLWFIQAWDLSWIASQYPWEASFKNNNPAWLTWGVSNELKNLWKQAGINITQWTSRPSNEWWAYIKFDTIEDWIKAYDIAMTQRRGNATVKTYLNWWGTWTVWLPENILNKKVKDLSAEEKKSVQNAQIKKESPWLYNYLQWKSQWTTETWQSNIIKSWLFDATFETYFEQQKKITSLGTEKDRQAIFASMWINNYTEFQRLANERKTNKPADQRTLQLLDKLDKLEKWVKTFWPRSLEVSMYPDLKADYNFIKSNLSLESLQAAKAKWATFWALSDAEWKILWEAATALSPRLSSNKFQEEIQNIRNQIYENYPSLRTQSTQSTQPTFDSNQYFWNLVNNQWAGNVQDNDILFILWY